MVGADFETNFDEAKDLAQVWSACYTDNDTDAVIVRNIQEFIDKIFWMGKENVYFHNLKFDGAFILDYLYFSHKFKHAWVECEQRFKSDKEMLPGEYKYLISDMGVWYLITIRTHVGFIRIYDSFKRAPMSLKNAGIAFATKHQKKEMNHEKWHDETTELTNQEVEYIKNDAFVLWEFLEEFEKQGHTKMTIGSCALAEFIKMYGKTDFKVDFPNIYLDEICSGMSIGDFVFKAYHGAFVYVNPYKKEKILHEGWTVDVNSLYAYVMHSMSGNKYPHGKGMYWVKKARKFGNNENVMNFVHFKCRFYLRDGYLPFVHILNGRYPKTKLLETSMHWTGMEFTEQYPDGEECIVDLTMQDKELQMFLKHYHVRDFTIIDGVTFWCRDGIFDNYIDHFMEIKANSTGAKRTIAKQFLVNLYGKFAAKKDSSFKVIDPEKSWDRLCFKNIEEYEKKPGYIPIGACITSNAMLYTLDHAQRCYHKDKPGFCYSDTDSIHGDGSLPEFFDLHKTRLGAWDLELEWDTGYFVRKKTYLETKGKIMKITCAGMPQHCKNLFAKSCGYAADDYPKSAEEVRFLLKKRKIEDFGIGLKVPGKLRPHRCTGGMALVKTDFTIKGGANYGRYQH